MPLREPSWRPLPPNPARSSEGLSLRTPFPPHLGGTRLCHPSPQPPKARAADQGEGILRRRLGEIPQKRGYRQLRYPQAPSGAEKPSIPPKTRAAGQAPTSQTRTQEAKASWLESEGRRPGAFEPARQGRGQLPGAPEKPPEKKKNRGGGEGAAACGPRPQGDCVPPVPVPREPHRRRRTDAVLPKRPLPALQRTDGTLGTPARSPAAPTARTKPSPLNPVPVNTEAISNPSGLSACVNLPFLRASARSPQSRAEERRTGLTFYVRAPRGGRQCPHPFPTQLESELALVVAIPLCITMSQLSVSLGKERGFADKESGVMWSWDRRHFVGGSHFWLRYVGEWLYQWHLPYFWKNWQFIT